MNIPFYKYQGTGNDFILIDDRKEKFDPKDINLIAAMCDRRFGIGADGLMLLRNKSGYDFEMIYFNSDGNQSSMCGNGGRCIVRFARDLSIIDTTCTFLAIDGLHEAIIMEGNQVKLKMNDEVDIKKDGNAIILDTGSPHYVIEKDTIDTLDVKSEGSRIRYSRKYSKEGINVNFVQTGADEIKVATYERGVEDETFSCGTGVTAAAIAINNEKSDKLSSPVLVRTKGGNLKVYFQQIGKSAYTDIWLKGPALRTFKGVW